MVSAFDVSLLSTPTNATSGYAEDETIRVRLDFAEAVSVTGTPYVVLNIGGLHAPRNLRVRLRHALSELRIHGAGGGLRFGRHFAVLGHVPGFGLRADFAQWREHLCSVRLPRGRARPAALGNQSGHKVDATPNFMPDPGSGRCPTRARARAAELVAQAGRRSGAGKASGCCSPPRARNATSSAIDDYNNHAINDAGAGHSAIQAFKDGFRVIASTATVMRGTTPGSPEPG